MDYYKLSLGVIYSSHFFFTKLICCIFPDNNKVTGMHSFLKADRAFPEKFCSATLNMGWLIQKTLWNFADATKKREKKGEKN